MKILHYFLGFPPYRSGGLTKYAYDLMLAQIELGDEVSALWPGRIGIFSKKVKIKQRQDERKIKNFELINPLPVPFDEGIKNFEAFTRKTEIKVFEKFLASLSPDAIHIHSLMGLPAEFIDAAKSLKIRMIYTTHDYFGLCPKVTFFRNGACCNDDHQCRDCVACNQYALSLLKIAILQSAVYRNLKDSFWVRFFRKKHRLNFFNEKKYPEVSETLVGLLSTKYEALRNRYISMLSQIDCIHYNSNVTKSVYERFFTPKESVVLPITHSKIKDLRRNALEKKESKILRLTYLAQANPIKGFYVMKQALDELWSEGFQNFRLNLFCAVPEMSPYMHFCGSRYSYESLKNVFAETDALLVPSVWYETFGFTVLEALSYGVPVVVSDHVGAKDIVGKCGVVVEAGSVESLKQAILSLDKEKISLLNEEIQHSTFDSLWPDFVMKNEKLYAKRVMG